MRRIAAASLLCAAALAAAAPAQASSYRIVYVLKGGDDGADPVASLIDVGGTLYGTTRGGGSLYRGTVFSLNPASGAEQVVLAFNGGNGAYPAASLVDVAGTLYGTTQYGGTSGIGTVFALDPASGAEQVVHSFLGASDGCVPIASLVGFNGALYGTTFYGGTARGCSHGGGGTIFSIELATGSYEVLHTFSRGNAPGHSSGGLTGDHGKLYGTAQTSNATDGVVFQLKPRTGAEKTAYHFQGGSDGYAPVAGLIDVGGILYGTTANGGGSANCGSGCGTVFSFDPATGVEKILYAFQGSKDGAYPYASLVAVGGRLYGTTFGGGSSTCSEVGCGTVFSLDPATGAKKTVHVFQGGSDGQSPDAGLLDVQGTLYGTTEYGGGASGYGTVFAINP